LKIYPSQAALELYPVRLDRQIYPEPCKRNMSSSAAVLRLLLLFSIWK